MRLVIPALFIRLPAMMKKGTASSGKLSMPLIMRCTTTTGGRSPLSRIETSAEPAIAMATGTPLAINPRNEPRSAGVIARTASRSTLPRTKASYSAFEDGLGTLEHAVALPPVDDEHLHRPDAREGEADHAHAVHRIHRQVDDGHLVVAHLLHHRPGEPNGVSEECDSDRVDQRRHRAADPRRQQLV